VMKEPVSDDPANDGVTAIAAASTAASATAVAARGVDSLLLSNGTSVSRAAGVASGPPGEPFLVKRSIKYRSW